MGAKEIGKWALAAVIVMYAIRYLRASNSTVASMFPQSLSTSTYSGLNTSSVAATTSTTGSIL